MTRKFETEYRISKADEILKKENAFRQDIDMRLDAIERAVAGLGSDADILVARVLRVIELEISPRAAELEALLTDYRDGVPAASVEEEADGRQFLTPDRRSAIVNELRGGVDGSGDTLAKLLAKIVAVDAAKATPGDIGAAVASLRAGVASGRDTLKKLSDLIDGVSASLATKAPLANAALTGTATAPTVGGVADNSDKISTTAFVQSVVAAKIADLLAHTFNNDPNFATAVAFWLSQKADVSQLASKQNALGFTPVQQGTGVNQNINSVVKIGWGNSAATLTATVDTTDFGKIWTDREAPASIGGSGYMRLPNNMILQWGMFGGGDLVVTFPIAFPNICVGVWAQLVAGLTAGESVSAAVDQISRWQFSKRGRYANAGGAVSSAIQPGYYFAIGY